MRRTQIYLEDEQHRRLAERAATGGTTTSRLIRDAIDALLDAEPDEAERLREFRAAARAAFGTAPYLPDGVTYVRRLRERDRVRERELERRWRG